MYEIDYSFALKLLQAYNVVFSMNIVSFVLTAVTILDVSIKCAL